MLSTEKLLEKEPVSIDEEELVSKSEKEDKKEKSDWVEPSQEETENDSLKSNEVLQEPLILGGKRRPEQELSTEEDQKRQRQD